MKTFFAPADRDHHDPLQNIRFRRLLILLVLVLLVLLASARTTLGQAVADYGDAPDGTDSYYPVPPGQPPIPGNFPTLFNTSNSRVPGAPGAHHLTVGEEWFGPPASIPSAENDANDSADPDGRPNLVGNDGFDDGLPPVPFFLVLTSLPPQAFITFQVSVAAGAPQVDRHVNIVIDWDRSGTWRRNPAGVAEEWVIKNLRVNVPPGTSKWITTPPFAWGQGAQLSPQIFWLRMTLSREVIDPLPSGPYGIDGWDGSGLFTHGETEDYLFHPGRRHDDPGPFPPPPLPLPFSGGAFSFLPGIELTPRHQDVSHGTPATVTVRLINSVTKQPIAVPPPAYLGWAVDDSFLGPPAMPPPYTIPPYMVGGAVTWPPAVGGSGSTATWNNGFAPNLATITVRSIIHPFLSPEEWAFRVRAKWPGIRVQTRKAIVHIWHSWYGCFALFSQYNSLGSAIQSLSLPPPDNDQLIQLAGNASTEWQRNQLPEMAASLQQLRFLLVQLQLQGKLTLEQRDEVMGITQDIEAAAMALGLVPVPVFAAPLDGETIRGVTALNVTTLSPGVTKTFFSAQDAHEMAYAIGEDPDGSDGWSVPWNTSALPDGVYEITATMENAAGERADNRVSVWLDNHVPGPDLAMVAPPPGAVVVGLASLSVMVPDPQEDVASCTFQISPDGGGTWLSLPPDFGGDDNETWQSQLDSRQLPAGLYLLRATAADEAGNQEAVVWPIQVEPSYAAWKRMNGVSSDEEDWDGDGLSAASEYYFGTNPLIADPAGSAYGLYQTPAGDWFLRSKRRPWPNGMVTVVEESQNLVNWTQLLSDPPDGSGTELQVPISGGMPLNFARFRFSEVP
jgi:hypothetical protein